MDFRCLHGNKVQVTPFIIYKLMIWFHLLFFFLNKSTKIKNRFDTFWPKPRNTHKYIEYKKQWNRSKLNIIYNQFSISLTIKTWDVQISHTLTYKQMCVAGRAFFLIERDANELMVFGWRCERTTGFLTTKI